MEKCCINPLGKYPHNEIINTGIQAEQAGIFVFYMTGANGNTFNIRKRFELGEELTIAIGLLNENMTYSFRIGQPDETMITIDDCDKFSLTTIINTQIDGCTNPCDADDDSEVNYYS